MAERASLGLRMRKRERESKIAARETCLVLIRLTL